nr:MAG TPA: hypothetical protein [Caudoviricetes sp.]
MKRAPKVLMRMRLSCCWGDNLDEKELNEVVDYIDDLEQQVKKQKEVIDKVIETLEKGITFCENDSQEIYDKCNIAVNREKKILDILKEVSE